MSTHFCPVHYGTCPVTGKISYLNRSDAKHLARRSKNQGAGHIGVYRCGDCGFIHLGHLGRYRIANGRNAA